MNKIVKKSISLMIILTIFIFMLTACEKDEQPDSVDIQTEDKNEIKIDEGNAKVSLPAGSRSAPTPRQRQT